MAVDSRVGVLVRKSNGCNTLTLLFLIVSCSKKISYLHGDVQRPSSNMRRKAVIKFHKFYLHGGVMKCSEVGIETSLYLKITYYCDWSAFANLALQYVWGF
ncbi:unnamed protein product [Ilex paraguariensis]|uniref:Uncharacterized protein n=1 Tax=Ilex paraguariensis TaxID=185542 RepID=A0ABC8RG73_9AQUA